jgi:DNA invertase Pin-like site-specific DNA recombinase
VSVEGDREVVHSYATQAARIEQDCERASVELLYVGRERNVSGGANLANRPELSRAVEAVEAGNADIIVAAYFDRFFRSLEVQGEVIGRIERAGGELLTLDHGRLTNGTPANRLQANIVGAMAQFFREQTTEKSAAGQAAAVARGATPWARIPLGYTRENGKLLVDEATKPIVQRVFDMRAEGVSISQIRKFLAEHGVERSHRGVQVMLASRIYLGEIHFGKLHNYEAHPAIVDKELWDRVQRMVVARGRQPSSDRLLARLGVAPLRLLRLSARDDEAPEAERLSDLPVRQHERLRSPRHDLGRDRGGRRQRGRPRRSDRRGGTRKHGNGSARGLDPIGRRPGCTRCRFAVIHDSWPDRRAGRRAAPWRAASGAG